MHSLYWTTPGAAAGPSACADVRRTANDTLVGWDAATEPSLPEVVDLTFVAGDGAAAWRAADSVVVTKCLADALFGGAPALGQTLYSMHRPPARITGVINDIRLHMPFLFQTNVVALYDAPPSDPRMARWLVRAQPGRDEEVRAAAGPALEALDPANAADTRIDARLFSLEGSHATQIAGGTVVVLVVVGAIMGLLAILGNLAVAAFLVGERRRILGVRRALGATRWDIFRYLLIENLIPTQLGNLLGIVALLATLPGAKARFAGIQLHLSDALFTAVLLSIGALVAKLLPALRATRIPPSEVTRSL
jgi:putative ABC transport system permease protein